MTSRSVNLIVRLTETKNPIPGSRAWVAWVLESGRVTVSSTKTGRPAVFFEVEQPALYGISGSGNRTKCLAGYFAPWDHGSPEFHAWPFEGTDWDDHYDGYTPCNLLGVYLTPAGIDLLRDFARKCRTLLRYRLRKENRKPIERLSVAVHDA